MTTSITHAPWLKGEETQALNRRTLLVLSAAASLGGCSSVMVIVDFDVDAEASPRFMEALRSFTRTYGYRRLDSATHGVQSLGDYVFEGWRTKFWITQDEPGRFSAAFVRRTDLWAMFGPQADLFAIADDFKRVIARVDGVRIRETVR